MQQKAKDVREVKYVDFKFTNYQVKILENFVLINIYNTNEIALY